MLILFAVRQAVRAGGADNSGVEPKQGIGCVSACNIDPVSGGSASKIDPPNIGLKSCPLCMASGRAGMLIVETIGRIRREHFVKGKSIKEIVRDLGISRNTVRKVLRSGETSFDYEREVQPRPKLGRWSEELERFAGGERGEAGARAADVDPGFRDAARSWL